MGALSFASDRGAHVAEDKTGNVCRAVQIRTPTIAAMQMIATHAASLPANLYQPGGGLPVKTAN